MCANPYRGEVALKIDGKMKLLRLNFAAISFLENSIDANSLPDLVERFSSQNYKANDILAVLSAGYYGANHRHLNFNKVVIDDGVKAAASAAILLLKLAFEGAPNDT